MLLPILPANIKAAITGPISRTMAIPTITGSCDSTPYFTKEGRNCMVKTKPIIKLVSPIRGKDL